MRTKQRLQPREENSPKRISVEADSIIKGSQKCYRTFDDISTSTNLSRGNELLERNGYSQKDISGMTRKESYLRSDKQPLFGPIVSTVIVASQWRWNHPTVESSSTMRTVKQTQTSQTSSKGSSNDRS